MKILCYIGIHKWSKTRFVSHGFSSNVLDASKKCSRCSKVKRWVQPKNE